ncbi:type II toxin-antitoxin system PemK/MazF family toxin [Nostoc sp. FACHB-152]|uniref:type II toxin-antitoxin system PemK/MazF family toxin n=1 Tax=unclassified Nostoc TaxID=2593658 RepID=UPI001683E355|nr:MULTISPECIES: type II toxin-antitoxin system PemK/MazF family toxin [unclassified Nostoc]MBD2449207.1 type II toxin-antitoxin system PemK/MazF family toxin [Nostoc sp. FACHB-152]MBD2466356.1 type II toxin-antitoxin system PemK/MazF family toxin [Nostoc sp. FACHB-145]
MTNFNFGDIVLVPFPFTDQTTTKKRPAIVISSIEYQRERSDLIVIAVTSQTNPATSFGEINITKWQAAGLIKPSIIKPVLTTIDKELVIKTLGRLEEIDCQELQNLLQIILG